jgi:hypothetical protein
MITTLLRPAADGDSDDGVLRRERRRDIDSAVGGALSLLARCCLALTSQVYPLVGLAEPLAGVSGWIVAGPIAAFNSP